MLYNKMPSLTAANTLNVLMTGAGLIEGDPDVLDSAGVYGKPTHAQHVYLPYYEGQMLLTRKCVPFVCLRNFQFSLFMIIITPLCTTSVEVKTVGGADTTLLWALFIGPRVSI